MPETFVKHRHEVFFLKFKLTAGEIILTLWEAPYMKVSRRRVVLHSTPSKKTLAPVNALSHFHYFPEIMPETFVTHRQRSFFLSLN
jgi:hypothetical protein